MRAPVAGDPAALLSLINASWTTQVVGVAAALGIADALQEGAAPAASLAARCGCDEGSLARLLEAMASLGLCARDQHGRYSLSPGGLLLRSGHAPSLRAWAIYNALHAWRAWGGLLDAVRTGRSARELQGEPAGYERLADPEVASLFHESMEEITALVARAVVRDPVFAELRTVVDIGGGHGQLLVALLRAHPDLRGAVLDQSHAEGGARAAFAAAGVAERASFQLGDFFAAVPRDADAYLLKSILHNWRDDDARRIVGRCREASAVGRLLLVERLLPSTPCGEPDEASNYRSDLNMMVGLGGRERTLEALSSLLAEGGYRVSRCRPLALGFSLVEAR